MRQREKQTIMKRANSIALLTLGILMSSFAAAEDTVNVYAAGSLRAVLTEMGGQYKKRSGIDVNYTFGASGLIKERIEKGELADVFASANMEHPAALAKSGLAAEARVFTRNELCALAGSKVNATSENLLDLMLDPAVKLGTSTPKDDPSGDYAWLAFEKAEKLRAGSYAKLAAKALKLTGGKNSPAPPPGRNIYGDIVAKGEADIFLTYCTSSVLAVKEYPSLKSVALPPALAVGAEYGLTVMKRAGQRAEAFASFLLSREGQAIFARHGFRPVR